MNIGDDALKQFLTYDLSLKSINLSGLIKLSDSSVSELLKKHNALEELDLSCLIQQSITDSVINSLSKIKTLVTLNISGSNFSEVSSLTTLQNLVSVNISNIKYVENSFIICLITSGVKVLRASGCLNLNNGLMESIFSFDRCMLLLLEINRTPLISDIWISKVMTKFSPNLRIIRATNIVWDPKNIGLKLPLVKIGFERPILDGMKAIKKKKNNDKNPVKMLEKFEIENKPKQLLEYYKGY